MRLESFKILIHNFKESLEWGNDASDDPLWAAFYRKAFPGLVSISKNDRHNAAQHMGVDRWLCFSNGKVLSVDEKKRRSDRGDILLEYVSSDNAKTPGWIEKDLAIDFLAYAFMPSRRCFMFPWPLLRRVWLRFGAEWKQKADVRAEGFRNVAANNGTYCTLSIAVPIPLLLSKISLASVIQIDEPEINIFNQGTLPS